MIEDPKTKIRRGMGPRRDPTSYQTQSDIVIPAGTLLRNVAGTDRYAADVGISPGLIGQVSVERKPGCTSSPALKRVAS